MTEHVRTLRFRGKTGPGGLERTRPVLGQLAEIHNGAQNRRPSSAILQLTRNQHNVIVVL